MEISVTCIWNIVISVVTHIANSPEAENVINENIEGSRLSIEPCGTPL